MYFQILEKMTIVVSFSTYKIPLGILLMLTNILNDRLNKKNVQCFRTIHRESDGDQWYPFWTGEINNEQMKEVHARIGLHDRGKLHVVSRVK